MVFCCKGALVLGLVTMYMGGNNKKKYRDLKNGVKLFRIFQKKSEKKIRYSCRDMIMWEIIYNLRGGIFWGFQTSG